MLAGLTSTEKVSLTLTRRSEGDEDVRDKTPNDRRSSQHSRTQANESVIDITSTQAMNIREHPHRKQRFGPRTSYGEGSSCGDQV